MPRLTALSTLAICALWMMPSLAAAEITEACKATFSGQRMKVIVANAPGGGFDTYARALAPVIDAITGARSTVINMPAANGLVAMTTLANSAPDELVMMVENGSDMLHTEAEPGAAPWSGRLQPLGVFYAEPSAWVGKADLDFAASKTLVAGASSPTIEFDLLGKALGMEIKLISGYSGSKETEAALLRGEVDLISHSLSTGLKSTKSGDLALKLVMADKPNDQAPGVPHAAGDDGLAATLAKDLAPEERARRIAVAGYVADVTFNPRAVFTHSTLREDLRACLTEAVGEAIRHPDFAAAAEAQGRPVRPLSPAEAKALFDSLLNSIAKLQSLTKAP